MSICIGNAYNFLPGEVQYFFQNGHGIPATINACRINLKEAAGKIYDIYMSLDMDFSSNFSVSNNVQFDDSGAVYVNLSEPLDISILGGTERLEFKIYLYFASKQDDDDIAGRHLACMYFPEFMGMANTLETGGTLVDGQQLAYGKAPGTFDLTLCFQGARSLNIADLAPTYSLAATFLVDDAAVVLTPAVNASHIRVPAAKLIGEYSLKFQLSRSYKSYMLISYWYADTIFPGKNATISMPDVVLSRTS